MIVVKIIGVTLLVAAVFLYDYPRLRSGSRKEKAVFVIMAMTGWGLALLIMLFPELPGPTEMINYVTKPIWSIFYPEG